MNPWRFSAIQYLKLKTVIVIIVSLPQGDTGELCQASERSREVTVCTGLSSNDTATKNWIWTILRGQLILLSSYSI